MRWGLIIALALGCGSAGGSTADEATGGAETTVRSESAPRDALAELGPAESGVRFGRLELGAGERLQVDASSCREGLV
ncbi:MAG TPA: hypothetical protein RMI62_16555, partial [Polyangiaceae bacterium LLY-WYZ-15_(1-7)]|nr:hypothetical protein [Polyangiaceae bacterium LLY-WYZ-15_(1-7)]